MASYAPNDTANQDKTNIDLISAKSPNRFPLSKMFRRRGMREVSEVLKTLLSDATPASTASVTTYQIEAVADTAANVQGGVRTVVSKELVGLTLDGQPSEASANTARAVTAADVTAIQAMLEGGSDQNSQPTYPTDASGNGGGGKLSGISY